MKEHFIRRERGLERPAGSEPKIAEILKEANRVTLYEDDALLVAKHLAGLSTEDADRFRRAVTKCSKDEERLSLSKQFLDLCERNGTDLALAKHSPGSNREVQLIQFLPGARCGLRASRLHSCLPEGASSSAVPGRGIFLVQPCLREQGVPDEKG